MGLTPYAARDVLRNRRRTVSSILGVLLAVTFIAGTFIAIDSSARATLDATLANIQGDFSFFLYVFGGSAFNYSNLENAFLTSPGIIDTSLYRGLYIGEITNSTPSTPSPFPQFTTVMAIDPDHRPYVIRDSAVTGAFDLSRGNVSISKSLAVRLGVGLGDRVVASMQYNATSSWKVNLTVEGIIESVSGGQCIPPGPCPVYSGAIVSTAPFDSPELLVLHLRDASWLLGQLNQTDTNFAINGEIWIDRAHYVNPYDMDATQRNLERFQRRIQAILGPGGSVQDNLLNGMQYFSNLIALQRIQYLLLSLPVMLLGVYLGAIGVDLSHAERRRELAVLKTRGARRGQVIGLLLLEAVVGGLVAAVIGLALGVGLSRFLLGVLNPYGAVPPYESFVLTPDTVLIVTFLGISLMGMVAYRSAKRTASLPIVETLRYYSPGETKIRYSPRTDIILVSVGIADYLLVWWSRGRVQGFWTFLLGLIPLLILPFVPVMLIIGTTRLLTRWTEKVYDLFSRAARIFTKDLYHVVRKNLVRNPRRSANVAIIIALGLAFGVFSLSVLATEAAHREREVRVGIGADMSVWPSQDVTNLTANLTAVPGVAGVAEVWDFQIHPAYCCATVRGIDPDSYFGVSQPESWLFRDGNPKTAHDILSTNGSVLVSQSYFDQTYLEIGDRIHLSAERYDRNGTLVGTVESNVSVGGVLNFLPGVGYAYGFSGDLSIYASLNTLQPFRNNASARYNPPSVHYLVRFASGADWRAIKEAVLHNPRVAAVTVTQEQVDLLTSNPFARAIYGFITLELAFIVVILTLGVGLILFAASLERDVEFAAMIARGSSGWNTAKLLVAEAFVIMLVGLVIGLAVGLTTAFFAVQFLFVGAPGAPPSVVPYFFVFPWEAVLLVLIGPAAILLSAAIVSVRTARLNVARVLKLRGG